MSLYEPLRESFRELNHLLIDRQQFNAEQTRREGDEKRADIMLASRLETDAFNKVMTEKRMVMEEQMNQFQQKSSDRQFGLQEKQFAFNKEHTEAMEGFRTRELQLQEERNKLESLKFDHTQSMDVQTQNRANELWGIDKQIKELERDKAKYEADQLVDYTKQRPIEEVLSGLDIMDDPIINSNPDAMNELGRTIWGEESKWSPDTGFTTVTGKPLTISKSQAAKMAGAFIAFKAKFEDTPLNVRRNIRNLNQEYQGVKSSYNKLSKIGKSDVRFQSTAAEYKVKQKELERKIREEQEKLSVPNRIASLEEKQRNLQNSVAWASVNNVQGGLPQMWHQESQKIGDTLKELYKLQDKEAGSGERIREYAARFDSKGRLMEVIPIMIAKNQKGGTRPWEENPDLRQEDGWKWMKESELSKTLGFTGLSKEQSERWEDGYKVLRDLYGDMKGIVWSVEEEKRNDFIAVQRIYTELIKSDKERLPGDLATLSIIGYKDSLQAYNEEIDKLTNALDEIKDPESRKQIIKRIEQEGLDFKADFGYNPQEQ